jgi:ribosome-associated toxin RatA of RatAB toxin-antitoxin module
LCENARRLGLSAGVCRLQVVERSAIVKYTPSQMFALVNDVGRYPEFLPWCVGSRVAEASETHQVASVKIAVGVMRTEFTTRNELRPGEAIIMRLVEGPFRNLTGHWSFAAIGEHGSRIQFRVEFEFNNRLTAAALGSTFESLCGTIVDAFVQRAKAIYA